MDTETKTKQTAMSWNIAILILLPALYFGITLENAYTPIPENGGYAVLETITMGEQPHFVTIRSRKWSGQDVEKKAPPILLILHGGPGFGELASLHKSDYLLEEHFLVVRYDQRSAGKSFRFEKNHSAPLSIQQHVDDAVELIHLLRERFSQTKIYLLGGSWGSILALNLAKKHAGLFRFVAVRGLFVDGVQSEILSRNFVLSKRPDLEDKLAEPPYDDRVAELVYERKILNQVGGMVYACGNGTKTCSMYSIHWNFAKALLYSKEMSWGDMVRIHSGMMSSLRRMWPEVQTFNAYKFTGGELDVPFLVLHGRHDHCTAMELVEEFVEKLEAPYKKLVWFENSAHSNSLEEPILFQSTIIETFLGIGEGSLQQEQ